MGAFAEVIAVGEKNIHRLPTGWSFEEACGLGATAGVRYGVLVERAKVREGEWVMITGASGVWGLWRRNCESDGSEGCGGGG